MTCRPVRALGVPMVAQTRKLMNRSNPGPDVQWMRTPLGILAIAALVVVTAAMFVPGARAQLATSVTRKPLRYVELFLDTGGLPSCASIARSGRVSFAVTSHLARSRPLPFVVTADRRRVAHGVLRTVPARTTHARPAVTIDPQHTSRLTVRLVGRAEQVTVRCGRGPQ